MSMSLTGHLGARAADLVDGRLSTDVEERAWQHVLSCPGCRQLVEAEGWAKRQLGGLNRANPYGADVAGVPGSLRDVLHDLEDLDAWLSREGATTPARPLRRTSLALAGAGTVGAAVFGLVTLTAPPTVGGEVPMSPASIRTAVPSSGGAGVAEPVGLRHTSR